MEYTYVGLGDFNVVKSPGILITMSLGSCVGVVLYDSAAKIGGLAHIMLPDSSLSKIHTDKKKFADTGIRLMIDDMIKHGANKSCIISKIAGGAHMFESSMPDPMMGICDKNVETVKKVLVEEKIKIAAEDTGKNYGRTLEFYTETGKLIVKTVLYEIKEL